MKFKFKEHFAMPPLVGAYYLPEEKVSYYFCMKEAGEERAKQFIDDIEQAITHEIIHFLIHKIAGEQATFDFDKIAQKVLEHDRTTYQMLY